MKAGSSERRAIWKKRIEEFRNSGLSRRAYCEKNGITKSTLDYWFTRINKHQKAEGLVELKMDNAAELKSPLTVRVGVRYQIKVQSDFDPQVFCKVVKALETMG